MTKMTTGQLQTIFSGCKEQLIKMGVPLHPEKIDKKIYTSSTFRRKLGLASYEREKDRYKITINKKILNSDTPKIEGVIIHELLHTLEGCMNHGKEWKKWAAYVSSNSAYQIATTERLENFEYDGGYWLIKCPVCGSSKTMFVKPHNNKYICKHDNIILTPVFIKKGKDI